MKPEIVTATLQNASEFMWLMPSLIMAVGIGIGYAIHSYLIRLQVKADLKEAEHKLAEMKKEADHILREAQMSSRDIALKAREEFERETAKRRHEIAQLEERLSVRETNLDRRVALLDKKEAVIDEKSRHMDLARTSIEKSQKDLDHKSHEWQAKIQEAAALSRESARAIVMKQAEDDVQNDMAVMIRHAQEEARRRAEADARDIVTTAIERYAASQVGNVTTTTVTLPSDDMKGRIIGREGRNIRSLEQETGCNILIDETPQTVVISGFDPYRREVARRSLERLVADGRIHPAQIEEIVASVRKELDDIVRQTGEEAVNALGLTGVAPELVRTLGLLKFRQSFSQNVLQHSIEMAHLMGMMASDLGLDPKIAKRVGLFHDIGKAIDHSVEGGHALIGADLLKRFSETPVVYNAVAAHHRDAEPESPYAMLASAADAITAARPGARLEATEMYLERLKLLEQIASGFPGVKSCFAVYAGRELRVMVSPLDVNDAQALLLARNVCKRIEEQVKYPGQIKVTVIRETRCIEYAR